VTKLLVRRALQGAVIVWLVTTFTFALVAFAPGDVVDAALAGDRVPQELRDRARRELCLDRPVIVRYGCWLGAVARGDLGYSLSRQRPVVDALLDAIPNTLLLMIVAIALSFLVGVVVGLVQVRWPGGLVDRGVGGVSLLFYSMPSFWLAIILMFVFSFRLGWTPLTGMTDPAMLPSAGFFEQLADRGRHLVLPVATLTLLSAAAVARFQRSALLDVVTQDFVRTARAKGLSEARVLTHHVLRNALLPTITLLGLSLPSLLGGAVLVETVFSWPGMGTLATGAVATRDYPLLLAITLASSVMVVVGSIVADVLCAIADPRVRIS
jgi:peptide/nickel transport system permease protein